MNLTRSIEIDTIQWKVSPVQLKLTRFSEKWNIRELPSHFGTNVIDMDSKRSHSHRFDRIPCLLTPLFHWQSPKRWNQFSYLVHLDVHHIENHLEIFSLSMIEKTHDKWNDLMPIFYDYGEKSGDRCCIWHNWHFPEATPNKWFANDFLNLWCFSLTLNSSRRIFLT